MFESFLFDVAAMFQANSDLFSSPIHTLILITQVLSICLETHH